MTASTFLRHLGLLRPRSIVTVLLLAVAAKFAPQTLSRLRRDISIDFRAGGSVWIGADSPRTDTIQLLSLLAGEWWLGSLDISGSMVIDVGAHRGYFGAIALAKGAARVVSYEPASSNFRFLTRAAASVPGRRRDWDVHQLAVGPTDGHQELQLSTESWSHSLTTPVTGSPNGREPVTVRSLSSVLADLTDSRGRATVKMDIEGLAGRCLIATPKEAWRPVAVLLFERETSDDVPLHRVLHILGGAGLELTAHDGMNYRMTRGSSSQPSRPLSTGSTND